MPTKSTKNFQTGGAEAILKMSAQASEKMIDLNRELEERVQERTAQLLAANQKLTAEIYERKKAELALLEVTERLNLALYAASMGTWGWNIEDKVSIWDPHMWALFGLPVHNIPTLMKHEDFLACIYSEDRERVRLEIFDAVLQKGSYDTEYRIIWPDGSVRIIAERGKVYYSEQGQPQRVTGVCWDVTERKISKRKLRETTDRLNMALEAGKVGTWYWDANEDVAIWDKYTAALMGQPTSEDFVRTDHAGFIACIHPEDRELDLIKRDAINKLPTDKTFYFEYRVLKPDGSVSTIAERGRVYRNEKGEPMRVTGVCQDITEQKETEARLKELSERLHLALDAASVGTWYWDMTSDKLVWDKHMQSIFALQNGPTEGSYADFLDYIHPDDRNRVNWETLRAVRGKETHIETEHRIIWPDGSVRAIMTRGRIYRDESGKAFRMAGASHDVTARRRTEQKLRYSEEKFRSIVETTSEWIWEIDREGRHTYCNPAVFKILGYRPSELLGQTCLPFVIDEERCGLIAGLKDYIAKKQGWNNLVIRWKHKEGDIRYLESSGTPILSEEGEVLGFRGADRDITARKMMEELARQHQIELAHAARLNSMGEMASTLAHELNQPLAAIANYTKGCVRRLEAGNYKLEQLLHAMRQAALQSERAGEIIHRMKNFVRKGKLFYETSELNKIIREMANLLSYETRDFAVAIQYDLIEEIPALPIDKLQIEQVLLNLIRNAIEAMQEANTVNPTILIRTQLSDSDTVLINIIDNGPGFTASISQQLMNPYFTTKPHGMGMGLAICRTIIEAHGGHLAAKPNPDGGAWFYFTLPVTNTEMI